MRAYLKIQEKFVFLKMIFNIFRIDTYSDR